MTLTADEFTKIFQFLKDSLPNTSDSAIINQLKLMETQMKTSLAELQAAVERDTTVTQSAITLLSGLAQQIKDAGTDPVALAAITQNLDANTNALAIAVSANTPVAPVA